MDLIYPNLGPPLSDKFDKKGAFLNNPDGDNDCGQLDEDDEDKNNGHNCDDNRLASLPEAEPLWYMAQLPDHKQLLTHPVITSFLCLKWRRIRPYYYINLLSYLAFVGCLTAYIIQLNTEDKRLVAIATLQ